MTITAETIIADIIAGHPEAAEVFRAHGLRCAECKGSSTDTIRDCSFNHGVPIPVLIRALNAKFSGG